MTESTNETAAVGAVEKQDDKTEQGATKTPKYAAIWICPISLELPMDPVTAMDGHIYDRECIEAHIKKNSGNLTSPMTREKMRPMLIPALHLHTIEAAIDKGDLPEDLVKVWKEKKKTLQQKKMEALLKKADDGDVKAMYHVGSNYEQGNEGFKQDSKLAFPYFKKAAEAGYVLSTAALGNYYLNGIGVEQCLYLGIFFLTMATTQGSDWAAYLLGSAFAKGSNGLNVDESLAILLLKKSLGVCRLKNLNETQKTDARGLLNTLEANSTP
ncbi:Sel1 domain protein repeat-containing protein [Seminavis robusta]|uniref:Sel1 domain protein repeat-containing protein n=1 Tax=Seminavis robusta TaxID=568900 RepID=A0A9N8HBI0_9STRA|nr:Sel1 domain protein repeat-containing protein [Seminavis robusta]|eukprot:Sro363_g126890.1 Sel1 domain protein repeat-containing protein (270) ;mRNA; r:36586-37395